MDGRKQPRLPLMGHSGRTLLILVLLFCLGTAPRAWATSASISATETDGAVSVSGSASFTTYHNCDNANPPNCVDVNTGNLGVYLDTIEYRGYLGGATGGGSANWSGQVNGALLTNGPHNFIALAGDSKGATDRANTSLTIDNTPKAFSLSVPDKPRAPFDITGSVSFKNNKDGSEGTVSLHMDGGWLPIASKTYNTTSPNISYSDMKGSGKLVEPGTMSNGEHTVQGTAVAANSSYATTSAKFTIDNTPQGLSVQVPTEPKAPFDATGSVQLVECPSTTEGTVQISLDGASPPASKAYEGTSPNFSYSDMKDGKLFDAGVMSNGSHYIQVLVYATNGSWALTKAPFTIDNTPKGLSVSIPDQPRAPFDVSGSVQLVECSTTSEGRVEISIDGAFPTAVKTLEGTSPSFSFSAIKNGQMIDAGAMANGPHFIQVLVYATNSSWDKIRVPFTVNNKPTVTVPSPGEVGGVFDPVASAQLVEVLAGNEGTLYMALDDAQFSSTMSKPCTGTGCSASWSELAGKPLDASKMSKGKHKIRAQANAFNGSVTSAVAEFTVGDYDPRDKTGSGNLDNAAPVKQ